MMAGIDLVNHVNSRHNDIKVLPHSARVPDVAMKGDVSVLMDVLLAMKTLIRSSSQGSSR